MNTLERSIMDEQTVARYWDQNASSWTEGVRAGHDIYRKYVNNPAFLEMLPDLNGKTVLDVGCGEGYNTRLFSDMGADAVLMTCSSLCEAAFASRPLIKIPAFAINEPMAVEAVSVV